MTQASSPTAGPEPEDLDPAGELLAGYIDRCQDGTAEPRADFLARHPEHAEVLERRLAYLEPISLLDPVRNELREIDGYLVRGLLGQGGMGIVYDAYDPRLDRPVAIKVLSGLGALAGERGDRFQREIATLARIRHPHIVGVHGSGAIGGAPYFVMERVDGRPLSGLIPGEEQRLGRAEVRERVELAAKLARALDHAHEQGVVHRDVKPDNVMVHESGEPTLIDFGLARDLAIESGSKSHHVVGTWQYTAPEQARGERVDRRADVYGLGVTLYHLLTGHLPYPAKSASELMQLAQIGPPKSAARWNRALSGDLATVLEHALEPDAQRRYASCADFADDLDAWLEDRPIAARRRGVLRRVTRFVGRHRISVGLVSASTCAALIAGGVVVERLVEESRANEFTRCWERGWNLFQSHTSEGTEADRRALSGAVAEFRRCAELAPADPDTRLALADVLHRSGRHEDAKDLLKQAKQLGAVGFYFELLEHNSLGTPLPALPWSRIPKTMSSTSSIDLFAAAITRVHASRGAHEIEGTKEDHLQEALALLLELLWRGETHFAPQQVFNVVVDECEDLTTPLMLHAMRQTHELLRRAPDAYLHAFNLAELMWNCRPLSMFEVDEIGRTIEGACLRWIAAGGGTEAQGVLLRVLHLRWTDLPDQAEAGANALALVDEIGDEVLLELGTGGEPNSWGALLRPDAEFAYVPAVECIVLHGQYERALELLARRSFLSAEGTVAGPAHLTLEIRRNYAAARQGRFAPDAAGAAAFLGSVEHALTSEDLAGARSVLVQLRSLEASAPR